MNKKDAKVTGKADKSFDDVLRQLLRAKPQHKPAKKKTPAKKTARR